MESLGMTVEKRDQLSECNDQGVPLDDFRLQFCDRCLNPECSRSTAGTSRFEQRTATWESRLFEDVPRLDPSDPRVEIIQAKRFREIEPKGVHEVRSAWEDPRDLAESSEPEEAPEVVEVPDAADFSRAASEQIDEPAEPPAETPAQSFVNTPKRPGQMIGGKKVDKQAASPVLDPWEPKKTSTDDDVEVVKPGARVRMGGSGV